MQVQAPQKEGNRLANAQQFHEATLKYFQAVNLDSTRTARLYANIAAVQFKAEAFERTVSPSKP